MTFDVTALSVKVTSDGITKATADLKQFVEVADKAEKANVKLGTSTKSTSDSQKSQASTADTLLAKMQRQIDLMGANTSQTNAYAAAMKGLTGLEQQMAMMLGAEADAYKRLAADQAAALAMNKALDAAMRSEAARKNAADIRAHSDAMRDAHAAARGLSGSLGALWMTYGAVIPLAVGVAIGASLKGIVTVGKDVEHTLESIRVQGQETTASVAQMRDVISELGKGIYGPREVAEAFKVLTLAGLKASESMLAVKASLNLATAGGTTIEAAATALVSIGSAIGATAKSYDYLADVIAKTANVSLASVDSVASSMKRASVVNKLYGASFEDIAIQVAALAQLKIVDTSAGTAILNFYDNAIGKTEKAKKALKELGMDFTDAQGKAKPLIDAFEEFAGKLNKFDQKTQVSFITDIFGKQAMRDVIGIKDMVSQAADDTDKYTNKLRELQAQIADAAGTAALASIQLALTSENQFKSVANTLQTSFASAFKNLEPNLNVVAAKLKEAFGSQEFINSIGAVANAIANVAVFLVENQKAVLLVVDAFVLYKAATIGAGLFTMIATGLTGVATAMGLVTVATNGALTSVGLLSTALKLIPGFGIILTALTAGFVLFNLATSKSKDHAVDVAAAYNGNYLTALREEATRIETTNKLVKDGQPIKDAELQTTKLLALEKAKVNNQAAIASAQSEYDLVVKTSNSSNAMLEALQKLNKAKAASTAFDKEAAVLSSRVIAASAEQKNLYNDEQAKAAAAAEAKAGKLKRIEEDARAENDAYHKALKKQEGYIAAANQALAAFEKEQNLLVKAGEISKLESFQNIGKMQFETSIKNIEALNKEYALASKRKDGTSDMQGIDNRRVQEVQKMVEDQVQTVLKGEAYIKDIRQASQKLEIKEMEEKGQWVRAAQLRYEGDTKAMYEEVSKAAKMYGDKIPELIAYEKQLRATQDAAINAAQIKETTIAFDNLHASAVNLFKGLVADNAGLGIGGIFTAAIEASDEFVNNKLPKLQIELAKLKKLADIESTKEGGGNPAAAKAYNEELSKMQGLANHQKTMWAEVGEAISKSLSSAFGNAGTAAGNFLQAVVKGDIVQTTLGEKRQAEIQEVWDKKLSMQQTFNELDKVQEKYAAKEAQARIKSYGDMAGAAKGFFKEGSNGYKVMADAEKAFRMLELAEALKAFVVKSGFLTSFLAVKTATDAAGAASTATYTVFEVAQAGLRAAAHGIVAVARAIASMPFPLNIVAGAATLAALIGFGVKMTGGGGGGGMSSKDRQEQAGTGTVLGDSTAKSESIAKSIEHLDKNSGLGLVHSQSMVNSLHNIEASMVGLSSLVVRGNLNTASVTGGVGKAQDLALKALSLDPLGSAGNKLLGGIGDRLLGNLVGTIFGGKVSVQDFGLNVNSTSMADVYANKLQANGYTDTKKSGGLFHSDSYGSTPSPVDPAVTQQISLILKGLGDSVKMAATSLGVTGADFEAHMNDFVAKIGKVSFKDLKGDEIQKQFAAIFSAIGDDMAKWAVNGLDKFTQTGEGALETLMRITNDFVQVGDVLSSVGQKFKVFGLEAVQLSEDFINLAGGLGKLTDGTKYLVDNIFTESEKLAPVAASLDAAMAALGFSYVKTIAQFDALIHAQDLNTVSGQQTYVALMNLAPAFKQVVDGAESAQKALYDESSKALGRLEDSINHEKSVAQAAYDAQIAIIKAQRSSAEKSFNDNKTVLNATIKTATEASSALKSLSSSLKQTLDSMYLVTQQAMRRDAAQALITKALDIARSTGVLPKAEDLADALKTVASPADNLFSTFEDYARDMGITTNKISSLKDITDKEAAKQDTVLSVAQKQLLKLEDQYKLTTANFDAQEKAAKDVLDAETTRLDAILDNAKKQLEVANGTYQAVLKLPDALAAFKAALSGMYGSAASASIGGGGGAASGPSVGTMATASPSKFGGTTYLPYNALYTPAPTNPADLASGKIWSEQDMGRAYMAAHTAANNFAFTPIDGSHADGLDYVPKDNYRANLHVGERVKTAKASRDEDSVAEEIRQMRADLNAALLSIAQNTGKAAKTLDKFDHDGMPTTRDYTLA